LREGIYLFDPSYHRLVPVVAGDLRTLAIGRGQRDLAIDAPVQLIYVVDVHRLSHTAGFQEPGLQDPEVQRSYYYVDTGSSLATCTVRRLARARLLVSQLRPFGARSKAEAEP